MLDGRIQNDENTKFILISGTHGAEDGRSALTGTEPGFVENLFYRQDVKVSVRLQDGTLNHALNGLGPLRTKFQVIDLADFRGNESGLVAAVESAKLKNGQNRIVLAFCHANAPCGDVKRVLKDNNM